MKFRQLTVDNANQELNLIGDGFPVPAATGRHAFPFGEGAPVRTLGRMRNVRCNYSHKIQNNQEIMSSRPSLRVVGMTIFMCGK